VYLKTQLIGCVKCGLVFGRVSRGGNLEGVLGELEQLAGRVDVLLGRLQYRGQSRHRVYNRWEHD